jgi:ferritin-like metal-binding protein YciE
MDMATNVDRESPAYDIFITALKNTHAMELQAIEIMQRQVDRIENYPELRAALEAHIRETEMQRDRLEAAMAMYDESPSTLKEGVLGLVGNLAALAHAPAQDEVVKNNLANHAFENYEIAAYETLLTMAREAGHTAVDPFEQSLAEEERMATTVRRMIPEVTRKYVMLTASGEKGSH